MPLYVIIFRIFTQNRNRYQLQHGKELICNTTFIEETGNMRIV